MARKNPPNFDALTTHFLDLADHGATTEGEPSGLPNDRLSAVTRLIELCFGPESAQAIAFDLLLNLDEFDAAEADPLVESSPLTREEYVMQLLKKEFAEES